MIYTALDNFYLTDEELANSPSRKHDIDEETETTLRIFGCELIQEAGILLKCPQAVMATGQVLFQRFFCRKSMRDFNVRRMACACLFLATKLEESHRRTRDILMVFDRINKRRDGSKSVPLLIPETKEYDFMKERVITYERILLKTFGFIIHAVHPHKYVNSFVHSLEGSDELQQLAWNMLNDSLRTTLCVRFKGHVVAAGAIYLAARRLQVPLPENPPWWEAFKVPTDQLVEAVLALHHLYQRPKAHYIEVNPEVLKQQQQAVSGAGLVKQLTPGLDANDSPAAQDSSVIRGGPDLASQQVGGPQAAPAVATTTAAPINGAAEMLAAAVAAAQQRLRVGVLAVAGAAGAALPKPDADVLSTVNQTANGPSPLVNGDGTQANGGGAASGAEGGAVQSRKRSRSRDRSRSQERSRKESRSASEGSQKEQSRSRSRSPERSRERERDMDRERSRRSKSRDRDRQRDGPRRDSSRRDRRSHSRSRSRDRRDRDRRDRRDRERDWERDRRDWDKGDRGRDRERDRERDRDRDRDRERDRERERDKDRTKDDRPTERDRDKERPRDDRPTERDVRTAGVNKDDGRDRKESGLPPLAVPPRHPDRSRR